MVRAYGANARVLADTYAKTGAPDAAAWTELSSMFGLVRAAIFNNKNWTEVSRLVRAVEKAVGVETVAVTNTTSMGALSGLSKQSRGEGGITAIMEKGMGGKPLPPDVQGMILSNLSGVSDDRPQRSPAAHLSMSKATAGLPTGGPGGQVGPGRRRKTRKGKKTRKGSTRASRRR
jgi:hypothetical protein